MASPARTPEALLRRYAWLVVLVAGAGLMVQYPLLGDASTRSATMAAVSYAAVAALAAGLAWRRPRRWRGWAFLVAYQLLFSVGNTFWAVYIIRNGTTAPADSWTHAFFIPGNLAVVAAATMFILARGAQRLGLLDAAILAAAAAAVTWAAITHKYLEPPVWDSISGTGAFVMMSYTLLDVLLLALVLRPLVTGRHSVPGLLVLGSAFLLVCSDVLWNWLSVASTYVPGSWADLGWIGSSILLAAGALHPRMAGVFEPAPPVERGFSWSRVALLAVASVVPAATLAVVAFQEGHVDHTIGIALAMATVALLVLGQVVTLLRREQRSAAELAAKNDRLLELDRMKDEFVASVSHELRTPLTSIRGYVELLEEGDAGPLNGEQREYVEIVQRNVTRLLGLVGDLLDVAQARSGQLSLDPAPWSAAALARDAVERAGPAAASRNISLACELDEAAKLFVDGPRISQALDNLLSNAIKFTRPGGSVGVRVVDDGGSVELEVEDDGSGIAAADLPHLFDRFYRSADATERAIQGTGLGLAISRSIVEAHGGTLSVTSELGAGSTFTIRLPASQARARVEELAA